MEYNSKNDDKPDGKPRHNGRIGFEEVHAVDLLAAM